MARLNLLLAASDNNAEPMKDIDLVAVRRAAADLLAAYDDAQFPGKGTSAMRMLISGLRRATDTKATDFQRDVNMAQVIDDLDEVTAYLLSLRLRMPAAVSAALHHFLKETDSIIDNV